MHPIKKKKTAEPNIEKCAELLSSIYQSDEACDYEDSHDIPEFSYSEVEAALKAIKVGKSADKSDIIIEIFKYGGSRVTQLLHKFINNIIGQGSIPDE